MATRVQGDLRKAALDALRAYLTDVGTSIAARTVETTLAFRTGAQPANASLAATGTLLCTMTLPLTCIGAPTGAEGADKVMTKAGTWSGTVVATGTVGWARFTQQNLLCIDVSCGLSGADINFDDVGFVIDGTVVIDTFTLSLPHST
jgi:hypothetical protein